jgi:hypothetical protein
MNSIPIEEFKEDYDWKEAHAFARWDISSVVEVISAALGENDGESWVCVVRLDDGRYGFLEAGCDYTGWDCQASGDCWSSDSLDTLQRHMMHSSARRRLGMELADLDEIPNREGTLP